MKFRKCRHSWDDRCSFSIIPLPVKNLMNFRKCRRSWDDRCSFYHFTLCQALNEVQNMHTMFRRSLQLLSFQMIPARRPVLHISTQFSLLLPLGSPSSHPEKYIVRSRPDATHLKWFSVSKSPPPVHIQHTPRRDQIIPSNQDKEELTYAHIICCLLCFVMLWIY